MGKSRPAISDAEREVLKVLWQEGESTVKSVHQAFKQQGQEWTRSTVITLLQRLERKGYVKSDKTGFAFRFRASVSLEDVMHERITQLAGELTDGAAAPLVLAFAQRHRFTPKEIEEFRRMIDELAAKQPNSKSKK